MSKKLLIVLCIATLVTGCATNRSGRSQLAYMSDADMNQMGIQAFDQMKQQKQVSNNQTYIDFVECIATPLTALEGGEWEVIVFQDDTFNAFALPGNKIGVHTGLIELVDNQDQLAAVIGHEIGHVINRHGNERVSHESAVKSGLAIVQAVANPTSATGQLAMGALGVGAQYGVILPYSRLHESEADIYGLDLMAKAGFDPEQSVALWQKMSQASGGQAPSEFLSTHPSHDTRIQDLQKHMPTALKYQQQAKQAGKNPKCVK